MHLSRRVTASFLLGIKPRVRPATNPVSGFNHNFKRIPIRRELRLKTQTRVGSNEEVMERREYEIVVAMCEDNGIGYQGTIPWSLPKDLARFYRLTTTVRDPAKRNAVIMGRKTWDSLPVRYQPLPKRLNVVLTHNPERLSPDSSQVLAAGSLQEALSLLNRSPHDLQVESVFVIGGGSLYKEAIDDLQCITLHVTHVEGLYKTDVQFPQISREHFRIWSASGPILDKASSTRFSYLIYTRSGYPKAESKFDVPHEESQVRVNVV